jgi:translation initiation factor eIF-2B subunit alpha
MEQGVRASVSSEYQLSDQETDELVQEFEAALDQDALGLSEAVAAIRTLLQFIRNCKVGTISGLRAELKCATETLIKARTSTVSVSSGCELFLRFITMTSLEGETVRREMSRECVLGGEQMGKREREHRSEGF